MTIWPKEVILSESENSTICPKIGVLGVNLKILCTNPYRMVPHFQVMDIWTAQTWGLLTQPYPKWRPEIIDQSSNFDRVGVHIDTIVYLLPCWLKKGDSQKWPTIKNR